MARCTRYIEGLSLTIRLYRLPYHISHRIRRFPHHVRRGVGVGAESEARAVMSQGAGQGLHIHPVLQRERCEGVPLRYNNDKQKKPLFSRGLSVCRLLFNSFSKLKIDENYKEKRRLFY